jgi:hypothetical protein
MSPELVDQTILACCKPRFLKVARIIGDVVKTLERPQPLGLTEEEFAARGARARMVEDFIVGRIKALVETARLEGAGDLDRPRHSEVRLMDKETNGA